MMRLALGPNELERTGRMPLESLQDQSAAPRLIPARGMCDGHMAGSHMTKSPAKDAIACFTETKERRGRGRLCVKNWRARGDFVTQLFTGYQGATHDQTGGK